MFNHHKMCWSVFQWSRSIGLGEPPSSLSAHAPYLLQFFPTQGFRFVSNVLSGNAIPNFKQRSTSSPSPGNWEMEGGYPFIWRNDVVWLTISAFPTTKGAISYLKMFESFDDILQSFSVGSPKKLWRIAIIVWCGKMGDSHTYFCNCGTSCSVIDKHSNYGRW